MISKPETNSAGLLSDHVPDGFWQFLKHSGDMVISDHTSTGTSIYDRQSGLLSTLLAYLAGEACCITGDGWQHSLCPGLPGSVSEVFPTLYPLLPLLPHVSLLFIPIGLPFNQCEDIRRDKNWTAWTRTGSGMPFEFCFGWLEKSGAWKHSAAWHVTDWASSISSTITCGRSSSWCPSGWTTFACSRACSRLWGHSAFQWPITPQSLQWVLEIRERSSSFPPFCPPLRP